MSKPTNPSAASSSVPSSPSPSPPPPPLDATAVRAAGEALVAEVGRALLGMDEAIRLVAVALLADGHVLLEDVPGTGKTTLAKAVARCIGLDFARIQFTPDLLPSDVTGLYWFDQAQSRFELREGPIFAHVVLADEINRATPRTQSALLEAMAERQVTIEGDTRALPDPFLVLATQNPVELEGTFPLPEAQIDRFLLRLALGYPDRAAEEQILLRHGARDALADVQARPEWAGRLGALRAATREVTVGEAVRGYILDLCRATREHPALELGASPRASLQLYRAARAVAALAGRSFTLPDDVKAVASPVLAHRLMVDATTALRGGDGAAVVADLLTQVPVPVEGSSRGHAGS